MLIFPEESLQMTASSENGGLHPPASPCRRSHASVAQTKGLAHAARPIWTKWAKVGAKEGSLGLQLNPFTGGPLRSEYLFEVAFSRKPFGNVSE